MPALPPKKPLTIPPVQFRPLTPAEYNFPSLSTSKDNQQLSVFGYNTQDDYVWEGYSSVNREGGEGGGRYRRWLRTSRFRFINSRGRSASFSTVDGSEGLQRRVEDRQTTFSYLLTRSAL